MRTLEIRPTVTEFDELPARLVDDLLLFVEAEAEMVERMRKDAGRKG